jgi:hypothetical protein
MSIREVLETYEGPKRTRYAKAQESIINGNLVYQPANIPRVRKAFIKTETSYKGKPDVEPIVAHRLI